MSRLRSEEHAIIWKSKLDFVIYERRVPINRWVVVQNLALLPIFYQTARHIFTNLLN